MLENLKKQMVDYVSELSKNINNPDDKLYVLEKTNELIDIVLKETEKIMNYKEDRINEILKKQDEEEKKLAILKEKLDQVYEDIYDEAEDNFEITCPYCGTEFEEIIDEDLDELIICPECGNQIELDWDGNPNDDDKGCSGNCGNCGECK